MDTTHTHPENHTYPKPITRLDEVRSTFNVVAAVQDAEAARAAIEDLERNGIDGSKIALLGSRPGDLPAESTRGGVRRVGATFVAGLALGGVLGGLFGWISGIGGGAAAWLWSLFGAAVGAIVVAMSSFGESRAWWKTFAEEDAGTLAVGVHTTDAEEADRGEQVLTATHPMSINRF